MHALLEIDGVKYLDPVIRALKNVAHLQQRRSFWVGFVKIENGKVTNYFQIRNYPFSHHHASVASFCPPECPCFPY